MEQKKKQEVFFLNENSPYKASLSTEELYTEVHGESSSYGTSANDLIKEMMANVIALSSKQGLKLDRELIITDYGCGRSDAANVVGWIINEQGRDIEYMLQEGESYEDILNMLEPWFDRARLSMRTAELSQVTQYGNVTVQRYDIGIPEFSAPFSQLADIVFCNDVAEHIPYEDIPAFIEDLEKAGKYVIMSISLRDAVNYCKLNEYDLLQKAEKVDCLPEKCIFLTKDLSGYYIFSLHVSILPKEEWQDLLGNWYLLPAQDYTAVSAVNFEIDEDYSAYKRRLICKEGFVDMIPIPTKPNSKYETDPILFRRTAAIQPHKHVFKLNVLEETFTENEFVAKERQISLAWLKLMEAEVLRNEEGRWVLTSIADNYIDRISALDRYSKLAGTDPKTVAERTKKYLYNVTGIKL